MSAFTYPFDFLVASATRSPSSVAISTVDVDMTYAELLDTSLRFAALLRERGVKPGDVVGVRAPGLVELSLAFAIFHEAAVGTNVPIGYLEAGGTAIDWVVTLAPLDSFPIDRHIVLDAATMERVATLTLGDDVLPYPSAQAVCRLPFSSGTTGRPKPVPLTIDTLVDRCIDRRTQWMPAQPYFCHLGLSTALSLMTFYAHVIQGETFISPAEGPQVLEQLRAHEVSCLIASPHQLSVMLTSARASTAEFPHLHTIMSAGAALPDFLGQQLMRRFDADLVVTYASTEAGSTSIRLGAHSTDGYAGTVIDGAEVAAFDAAGARLPDGEQGLIGVKRARQPQAYLGEPEATARSFREGFFFSGDLGHVTGDQIFLAGRQSEIINAAGIKVDPTRVEAAAYSWDGVREAAAFGFFDARGLEVIALVFVSDEPIAVGDLMNHLRMQLGESTPTRVARVDAIPRNHSGKVNRDELARLFTSRVDLP
jgi:acyl-coenzyme A synthetase/AMP-(fatty) acid ligase